jgi:hypothetical protein
MLKNNLRAVSLCALALLSMTLARAQTPDYHQEGGVGSGPGRMTAGSGNPNSVLIVDRISPTLRIPVRTSSSEPLQVVTVRGHRDMYCTRVEGAAATYGNEYVTKKFNAGGGELGFREALYRRLAALDAAGIQSALQRSAQGDRAAQYRELFGVELPALSGEWQSAWTDNMVEVQQMQLNTGMETTLQVPNVVCATPAQVDAAIATAKTVYRQVIAATSGAALGGRQRAPSSATKPQ